MAQEQDSINKTGLNQTGSNKNQRVVVVGPKAQFVDGAVDAFSQRCHSITSGKMRLEVAELAARLYDRGVPQWWDLALTIAAKSGRQALRRLRDLAELSLLHGVPPDESEEHIPF